MATCSWSVTVATFTLSHLSTWQLNVSICPVPSVYIIPEFLSFVCIAVWWSFWMEMDGILSRAARAIISEQCSCAQHCWPHYLLHLNYHDTPSPMPTSCSRRQNSTIEPVLSGTSHSHSTSGPVLSDVWLLNPWSMAMQGAEKTASWLH